jgi:hypothetical protein
MSPKLTRTEAEGMTVNERLFAAGLLPAFDAAVASRDEDRLRSLLGEVFLHDADADAVVRSVLARGRADQERP